MRYGSVYKRQEEDERALISVCEQPNSVAWFVGPENLIESKGQQA